MARITLSESTSAAAHTRSRTAKTMISGQSLSALNLQAQDLTAQDLTAQDWERFRVVLAVTRSGSGASIGQKRATVRLIWGNASTPLDYRQRRAAQVTSQNLCLISRHSKST